MPPMSMPVQRSLDYAWDHARDGRGLFETDFTGADKQAEKWLLTQGAMAEMYGRMVRRRTEINRTKPAT